MGAPRYDGNGFSNPLNPLSLHSENHYRDEPLIGSSFMSDERRIFGVAGAVAKGGAKAGSKAGAKAAAKAAAKASAKAGSKATKSALKATKNVIKATYKSPTTKLLGAVGIGSCVGRALSARIPRGEAHGWQGRIAAPRHEQE